MKKKKTSTASDLFRHERKSGRPFGCRVFIARVLVFVAVKTDSARD